MNWEIWIVWWITFYTRYSTLFWIYIKKHGEKTIKPSIRIYTNKIENRKAFKIKKGNYLELLLPDTMKLLEGTKSKITKDKNGEMFLI